MGKGLETLLAGGRNNIAGIGGAFWHDHGVVAAGKTRDVVDAGFCPHASVVLPWQPAWSSKLPCRFEWHLDGSPYGSAIQANQWRSDFGYLPSFVVARGLFSFRPTKSLCYVRGSRPRMIVWNVEPGRLVRRSSRLRAKCASYRCRHALRRGCIYRQLKNEVSFSGPEEDACPARLRPPVTEQTVFLVTKEGLLQIYLDVRDRRVPIS